MTWGNPQTPQWVCNFHWIPSCWRKHERKNCWVEYRQLQPVPVSFSDWNKSADFLFLTKLLCEPVGVSLQQRNLLTLIFILHHVNLSKSLWGWRKPFERNSDSEDRLQATDVHEWRASESHTAAASNGNTTASMVKLLPDIYNETRLPT